MHRSHDRGTMQVDIRIRGIEIKKATGCHDTRKGRSDFAAVKAMLRSFGEPATERLDLLRDIADGRIKIIDAYPAYQQGTLDQLVTGPRATADLRTAWDAWVKRSGGGNVRNRTYAIDALLAVRKAAKVADLPPLVRAMIDRYQAAGKARTGNQYRVLVLAFLRDTMGKRHPLKIQVGDIPSLPYKAKHGNPQTVVQATAIRSALPTHHGNHWWDLCLTGMRSKEYFETQWSDVGMWVEVAGTKNASADRIVPKVEPLQGPKTQYQAFRKALAKLAKKGTIPKVTAHDARRSFRIWLRQAGVARVDRDLVLGHAGRDMEAIYEHQEQVQVMNGITGKLKRFIQGQRKQAMRKMA